MSCQVCGIGSSGLSDERVGCRHSAAILGCLLETSQRHETIGYGAKIYNSTKLGLILPKRNLSGTTSELPELQAHIVLPLQAYRCLYPLEF